MNANKEVYVIGAGGHAKVVIRAIQALGRRAVAVFDDNPLLHGGLLLDVPIVGPVQLAREYPSRPSVVAIGNCDVRRRIVEECELPWTTVIHPRAFVDASVSLGQGTVVLANAVVQVDSVVGDHVIVNHAATIDHDCVVEDYVHLAPGVHLAGNVFVGKGAFMGIGAVAIPGKRIGDGTVVGAGTVIIDDLPAHAVAVGVPARVVHDRLPPTVSSCGRAEQRG